jgi:hypothetical protein
MRLACKKTLLVTGDHLFAISLFHDRGPLLLEKVVSGTEISRKGRQH